MEKYEKIPSLGSLILSISFSVFLTETVIMNYIDLLAEGFSGMWVSIIDATLLVLITSPFVYYFSYKPLRRNFLEIKANKLELERKHQELFDANKLVEAMEEKYNSLFDFAPVGYMILDHDDSMIEINQTGANLLGISKFKAVGKSIEEFLSEDEFLHWSTFKIKALQSKTKLDCKLVIHRADGTAFYALFECLHNNEGIQTNLRISFTDITQENFINYKE